MTRTRRWKLQYLLTLGALLAVALGVIVVLRPSPPNIILLGVLFLVPGRLHGFLWREIYRGRRLHAQGAERTTASPWLAGIWWLAWAVYTRDGRAMAHNNIGCIHLDLGNLAEARASLEQALAIDPLYPIPHVNLARIAFAKAVGTAMRRPSSAPRAERVRVRHRCRARQLATRRRRQVLGIVPH